MGFGGTRPHCNWILCISWASCGIKETTLELGFLWTSCVCCGGMMPHCSWNFWVSAEQNDGRNELDMGNCKYLVNWAVASYKLCFCCVSPCIGGGRSDAKIKLYFNMQIKFSNECIAWIFITLASLGQKQFLFEIMLWYPSIPSWLFKRRIIEFQVFCI